MPVYATLPPALRARLAVLAVAPLLLILHACGPEMSVEVAVQQNVNVLRRDVAVQPLAPDARLVAIARARSEDMARNGYFSHHPPGGCDYLCLMDRNGVAHTYAGETIAWNTHSWDQSAPAAVAFWAASPPHRARMLDCHYERFGTGVAAGDGGRVYITTIFEGAARC